MPNSQNISDYDVAKRQELTRRLRHEYDLCALFPEDQPDGWIRLINLRNAVGEALGELERDLPPQSAEAAGQKRFRFG